MMEPMRDVTVKPDRDTAQPDNGAQTMTPSSPVIPADDGELREQATTDGVYLLMTLHGKIVRLRKTKVLERLGGRFFFEQLET